MPTTYLRYYLTKMIWLILWPFVLAAEEQPYVTCNIMGQLGNQMFQIAATLAYAWDNDVRPIFPELNNSDYNIPYNREHIFFRLDASPLPRPVQATYNHYYFNSDKIPFHPDQYLSGFFQHWKLFDHHREKILETFAASESVNDYLSAKYSDLISHPNTVAVHVRTLNAFVHHSKGLFFVGLDYFQRATNLFPEDVLFVVFSDRINWCKHHFRTFNKKNIVYVEGNDHIQDLYLMSKMKHHIISNSTFSWWAAYMNTNPLQVVVSPVHWFNPIKTPNLESVNLPDWITLEVAYDAPYPRDIRKYERHSQSMDNQ